MVQTKYNLDAIRNNSRRQLARSLRNGGYSYSEIQKFVSVPKATLNLWLNDIKLSDAQLERLVKKRAEASIVGVKRRTENVLKAIEEIQTSAAKEIGKISKRELWLMGVMLYWKNRNQGDVRKGVRFVSSDPDLVNIFIKWLKEVGQLSEEEILFDILARPERSKDRKLRQEKVINFWSETTGFSRGHFSRIYKHNNRAENGILQIRVRSSSMLARQLSGWIKGIQEFSKH